MLPPIPEKVMIRRYITTETKQKLLGKTAKNIEYTTTEIDTTRKLIRKTQGLNSFLKENRFDPIYDKVITLLEFRLLVGILLLDLNSALRIYLNAKYQYEGFFSARQVFVIINEGYKKLYNFITKNKDGSEKFAMRNDSFWKKDIGNIVKEELTELEQPYEMITQKLEDYYEKDFENIKTLRDLSIHYGKSSRDKESVQVYDMIAKIDIDDTFQTMIPFMDILSEMFLFTNSMVKEYKKSIIGKKLKQKKSIDNIISMIKEYGDKNRNFDTTEHIEKLEEMKNKFFK